MMKMFSFDVETDGLYGEGFAVGAVVRIDGEEVARFAGIAQANLVENQWVQENVIPHLSGLPEYATRIELRTAFWQFWMSHRDNATCIADFGSPVEAGWFRQCIADDLDVRMWNGPYPLHEVGTALLMAGINPDTDRSTFYSGVKHNPLDDAIASAMAWETAIGRI